MPVHEGYLIVLSDGPNTCHPLRKHQGGLAVFSRIDEWREEH
jgi:hypothetical protein